MSALTWLQAVRNPGTCQEHLPVEPATMAAAVLKRGKLSLKGAAAERGRARLGCAQQGTERAQLACEEILGRLRTDHVDLLLIHWPGVAKLDTRSARNAAKRLETWRVLEDFYRCSTSVS